MPDPRAPPAGFGGLDRVRDRHGALAVLAHDGPDGRAGRQQDANLVVYVARPGDVAQVWPNASALDGDLRAGAALRQRRVWRGVQRFPAQRHAERVLFALHDRGRRRRAQQFGAIDPAALALVGAVPVGEGAAPYLQLQLEAPFSACPWRAAYGSQIALAYEVTIEGDLSYLRPARDGVECHRVRRVGARPARRLVGLAAARGRADARPHHRGGELPAGLRRQFHGFKGGGSIWLCNLTVIRDERAPPSCASDPADEVAAWPAGRYYTGAGAFLPLLGHVSPGYDCFGDACNAGPNAQAAAPAVRV